MGLGLTAIDAIVGALATAFFGGMSVLGVFLLNRALAVDQAIYELRAAVRKVQEVQDTMEVLGSRVVGGRLDDDNDAKEV